MNASVLRKMLDMGLTLEQACELAEVWEAGATVAATSPITSDTLTKKRARDAARMREKRDAKATVAATSLATSRDVAPSRTQVVVSSLPSLRSEEVGGGGGGERERDPETPLPEDWPSGKASDHAKLLIAEVASPWLDPNKSLALNTTEGRLAAWKRDGASWQNDVLPVVKALCGKQRAAVSSWKFFDPAIGRSIADNRAALLIPEAGSVRATGPPDLPARIAAEHAEARRRVLAS